MTTGDRPADQPLTHARRMAASRPRPPRPGLIFTATQRTGRGSRDNWRGRGNQLRSQAVDEGRARREHACPGAADAGRHPRARPRFVHQHDPITDYKWMVNVDDTGDPGTAAHQGTGSCLPPGATGGSTDPDFADTCPWPSIRNTSGYAPIVAQGNQDDLGTSTALDNLPPGKYLISVTADGFKIDGEHFTVQPGSTQQVTVGMNPTPLPLTTIQIQVFQDQAPVDATYEADAERGLAGFGAHLTDVFGEVSTDYYGNPLCTQYQHVGGDPNAPIVFDAENHPVVSPDSVGRCLSDRDGIIKIPNLGP